jgi:hypothetical protein
VDVRSLYSAIVSAGIAFVLSGLCFGGVSLAGVPLFGVRQTQLVAVLTICIVLYFRKPVNVSPTPFLLAFILLVLSDFTGRRWTFFAAPFSGPLVLVLLILLLAFSRKLGQLLEIRPSLLLGGIALLLFALLLKSIDGRQIFGDDHPSFFYRLSLLALQFPGIPFYNPQWNAGVMARDFYATGAIGPFLLFWPLVRGLSGSPELYSVIVATLAVILPPLSVYLAGRVLQFGAKAALLSAILAFAPSLQLFEWLFHYGTLGFIFSVALSPLVFALTYRAIFAESHPSWLIAAGLVISGTLCFLWTLSVIVVLPLVVLGLLRLPVLSRSGRIWMLLAVLLAYLLINGSWLYTFVRLSKVQNFVSGSALPGAESKSLDLQKLKKKAQEMVVRVSPFVLLLFVPSIFALKRERPGFLVTIVWLLLLATIGDQLKPQLELNRAWLFAVFLALPPIGVLLARYLESSSRVNTGIILLGIFLSPINAAALYQGRSDLIIRYAPQSVAKVIELFKSSPGEGRIFFLGFVLHELGQSYPDRQDGGHLAPLPLWVNREMYASHFFHARWSAVDPIPPEYRKRGEEGIEEFLDLVGATEVVSFDRRWVSYTHGNSRYELVGKAGAFHLYIRRGARWSPVVEGEARIDSVGLDELRVTALSPRIVLRYRYIDGLRADNPGIIVSGRFAFNEEVGQGQIEPFEFIELNVPPEMLGQSLRLSLNP